MLTRCKNSAMLMRLYQIVQLMICLTIADDVLMLLRPHGESQKQMYAIDARVTAPASANDTTSNSKV